jgi:UDP-glucose 4-epimerase
MNYLITGGSGYLGMHLTQILLEKGHHLTIFELKSTPKLTIKNKKVSFVEGDVTNPKSFEKLSKSFQFDGVFHVAAKKSVSESIRNPDLYHEVNCTGTQNVINYCQNQGINSLVFTSSAAVYGGFTSGKPILETADLAPASPYGESKFEAEKLITAACAGSSLSASILRVFNIIGSSHPSLLDKDGENVIPIMCRCVSTGKTFTVYGNNHSTLDGTCVRDYIDVFDVAVAHASAMNLNHSSVGGECKIFNISSGQGVSMLNLINLFNSNSKRELNWEFGPKRYGEAAEVIGDNSLAHTELDWKPTISFNNSLVESMVFQEFKKDM